MDGIPTQSWNVQHYGPSDVADAGADYIARAMGAKVKNSHPVASDFATSEMKLSEMAQILGETEAAKRGKIAGASTQKILSLGINTDTFQEVLEAAVGRVVYQRYEAAAEHLQIVSPMPLPNYRPAKVAEVDVEVGTAPLGENEEIKPVNVEVSSGVTLSVLSYARNLLISYALTVNDDVEAIASVAGAISGAAARLEQEKTYGLLDSNPNVSDGSPLFTGGNHITGAGAFSADTVATAMAALRNQPTPNGKPANHRLRFLVVHTDQEYTAHKVVADAEQRITVIASPHVTNGRFFGLADPAIAPVIGMGFLAPRGTTTPQTLRVQRRPYDFPNRRSAIGVFQDFGLAALSRQGAVRVDEA